MKNMDRDRAAVAIATCDQIEAAVKDGDAAMIDTYKQYLRDWAADLDEGDLLMWVDCVRAKALEVLMEDRNGSEFGAEPLD